MGGCAAKRGVCSGIVLSVVFLGWAVYGLDEWLGGVWAGRMVGWCMCWTYGLAVYGPDVWLGGGK